MLRPRSRWVLEPTRVFLSTFQRETKGFPYQFCTEIRHADKKAKVVGTLQYALSFYELELQEDALQFGNRRPDSFTTTNIKP
ncbi:hypothetical protein V6N13_144883 [Hibiscus sabdariffa]